MTEIFSENMLGIGYHSDMPRDYTSAFSRTGADRQSPVLKPWKIIKILKKTLVPKFWASFKGSKYLGSGEILAAQRPKFLCFDA